tara:strand:+ start:4368 stop:4880 length:513 start_codon:yes stop_codon:yes gene_type:complete
VKKNSDFLNKRNKLSKIKFSKENNYFYLKNKMILDENIEKVFRFFETPKNLNLITPSWLNFKIITPVASKTYKDQEIEYKLTLHKITFKWKSKITEYKKNISFCDKQIKGPYLFWEHSHLFSKLEEKTLMKDVVKYKVIFGSLTNKLIVKKDLRRIFDYRQKKIQEIFKK